MGTQTTNQQPQDINTLPSEEVSKNQGDVSYYNIETKTPNSKKFDSNLIGFLILTVIGAVNTLQYNFTIGIELMQMGLGILPWADIIAGIIHCIFTLIIIFLFRERNSNAIFLAILVMSYGVFTNLFGLVSGIANDVFPTNGTGTKWQLITATLGEIAFILYLLNSKYIMQLIPNRKPTLLCILLSIFTLLIPIGILCIGWCQKPTIHKITYEAPNGYQSTLEEDDGILYYTLENGALESITLFCTYNTDYSRSAFEDVYANIIANLDKSKIIPLIGTRDVRYPKYEGRLKGWIYTENGIEWVYVLVLLYNKTNHQTCCVFSCEYDEHILDITQFLESISF